MILHTVDSLQQYHQFFFNIVLLQNFKIPFIHHIMKSYFEFYIFEYRKLKIVLYYRASTRSITYFIEIISSIATEVLYRNNK